MVSGAEVFEVILPVAPLHRGASRQSALETQLLHGERFLVQSTKRGWAKGQAQSPIKGSTYPGYAGYMPLSALQKPTGQANHIITALAAPVFADKDIKSTVLAIWPMNARTAGQIDGDFVQVDGGSIHHRHIRPINEMPAETDFVTIAERHIGRPYIWGGVSTLGLDCSGLVQSSLRATGRDCPRDAKDQKNIGGEIKANADLKRGDLIFWRGHVGIMQDDARLLHANAFHMGVESETLLDAETRIAKTYGPITARRRIV